MKISPRIGFFIPAFVGVLLCLLGSAGVAPQQNLQGEEQAAAHALTRFALPGTGDLQLIVELEEPSVIQALKAELGGGQAARALAGAEQAWLNLRSARALDALDRVRTSQRQVVERLSAFDGVRVEGAVDVVLNAVIVRIPLDRYFAVRRIPGVRKVHFSRQRKLLLDAAAQVQNAALLWNKAGGSGSAGKGVKIGLIDTGIDIDNPMFIDNTLSPPAGYPKGEAAYTNSKVIVARNFVNLLANPQTVRTAIDEVGHGSFVAGCAAGKRVNAPLATISGMAPGAFLGNYKVFGTPGINDHTTSAAVIAAVNAAVNDGMDVLNLSLGALDYAPVDKDPEIQAIENAVAAGVVVVIAAGNEGPETHTIANPGTAPSAITVGAVSNGRVFATLLRAIAPAPVPENLQNIAYTLGTGPEIVSKIPARPIVDVSTLDGSGLACSAFPAGSLTGKIAFIQRGTCTFTTKVANAANAGATAAIVYNNVLGAEAIVMGGLESARIPAVMISNPDGLALKDFIAANAGECQVEIDDSRNLVPKAVTPGLVTDFSSRGPGFGFSLKPDVVAVGSNVHSAAQNNNSDGDLFSSTQFAIAGGTSFSTSMVAGAAATLKALNPAFTAEAIKSVLVDRANRNAAIEGGAAAGLLAAGAGLLDMGSAGEAAAVFSPPSLSFGVTGYGDSVTLTRTLTLVNASNATDQFSIQVDQTVPGPSVQLSRVSTGIMSPGGSATVDVVISATPPLTGGFQGLVRVTSQRTSATYQVPYWVGIYVPDAGRILTVTQSGGGRDTYSSLSAAVRAARPGNVIEIADDSSYAGGLVISTNAEGLPLHGITIRAATGKFPVIASSSTTEANIRIVGLRDVAIQGLNINGGQTGIELLQPAASQPLVATIDDCVITNSSGGSLPAGITVDEGATAFVTRTTISGSQGFGILAYEGAHLTMTDSTIDRSVGYGIAASAANVQILRSSVINANGPGGYFWDCSGTIRGSTFANCRGSYGDGLEIVDGALTISRCTLDSNARAGIGLFADTGSWAGGLILQNTIRSNGYGVVLSPGHDVLVESNLLKNNSRGIYLTGNTTATLANNIIVQSTVGDGIQLAGTANAMLVNNTIYRNSHRGVLVSSGATVSIVNCIIAANGMGDLDGIPAVNVSFSLIGDGSQTGGNNVSGDPKFTNPDGDDYSLAPGSPAVDAGSNTAPHLPFLDYDGRLRVASAGLSPGDGKADIGATESNSAYPLVFPLLANGNQATLQENLTTGFGVLNTNDRDVPTLFSAFEPGGQLLAATNNPASWTFRAGTQVPILGFQLFGFDAGASRIGSVLVAAASRLTGFFLVFDQDFSRIADGVDVSDVTSTDLLLMRHLADSSSWTTYVVCNPGTNPANINATLYSRVGFPIGEPKSAIVQPKGQVPLSFNTPSHQGGYVRVRSDRPVSGLELFGDSEELSALRAVSPGTEGRLYFPHFAVNGGFTTVIVVVNGGDQSADVELTAHGSDGRFLRGPVTRTLPPGGQLLESVSDLFGLPSGGLMTGYIVAKATRGGIAGFTSYRYENGPTRSAAAVPAGSVPAQRLLFSHIAHQVPAGIGTYYTGIALLNPFGVDVSYTMRVFNGNGDLLAEMTGVLGPGEKVARILSHPAPGAGFFTQQLPLRSGHVEVLGELGLLGFELFFTDDFSQLASVPAQLP